MSREPIKIERNSCARMGQSARKLIHCAKQAGGSAPKVKIRILLQGIRAAV